MSVSAGLPAGVYGPAQVNPRYDPWAAVRDTRLRVGPSTRAPALPPERGLDIVATVGTHVGRQTTRNPVGLARPPLRDPVEGYVWGYLIRAGYPAKSGWARLDDLEPDPDYPRACCGPAGFNRDRRGEAFRCPKAERPRAALHALHPASGAAVVNAHDLYLRWNPHGAAFRYLVRGDVVVRLCRHADTSGDYTAVAIVDAAWAPAGARGWVDTRYLSAG